jgi:hypothetical protein
LALTMASSAMAEDAKPQWTQGVSVGSTSTLPVGAQIPELPGYALRMRVIVREPCEQWVEGADVAHWSENRGTETAYLINVDILPGQ